MREIKILWAGRHREAAWEPLFEDYRKRIQRHYPVSEVEVRVRGGDEATRLQREETAILQHHDVNPFIALDQGGKGLTSEQWARRLSRWMETPHGPTFVLGSDLGLGEGVLTQANEVISFGPVTLAHRLAKLVLYEQIYRGIAQLRGIKYHRQRNR